MFYFPQIAATAKRLSVAVGVCTAIEDRNDVIQFQMFSSVTENAVCASQGATLKRTELLPMASQLWRFVIVMGVTARKIGNLFCAVFNPFLSSGFRNALLCLFGVAITQGVLIAKGLPFSRGGNLRSGFGVVRPIPEVIAFPLNANAHALFRTSPSGIVSNLSGRTIEAVSANLTIEVLTFSRIRSHFGSIANAVNSGKHLDSSPEYKSILSQAQAGMRGKVQRLEAETRTVGNASTSAAPERDDIVRAVWRHTEARVKFQRDNTTDDIQDTTPMDGITAAFYNWVQLSVPITISRIEERKNSGEFAQLDLLEEKSNQAMDGILEKFTKAFLQGNGINSATAITTPYTSTVNGSTFLSPLPLLVGQTPTAGTVGSIACNVSDNGISWWANQKVASTDTNFASQLKSLANLYNSCSKGVGGGPDMHLTDQSTAEWYEAALRSQNRFTDYARADIPFDNVLFRKSPVVWDEYMPNWSGITTVQSTSQGSWVMLNSKFIQVKYDNQTNFMTTPFVKPENQDAKVAMIQWYGSAGVNNRRKHGVDSDIDTTITS